MQKKGVQISSTTLNLRFMQNAKIRQEQRETEVSQVKIQNKEQWHLDTPEEWVESRNRTDGASQNVVHESSYLPFLLLDTKPSIGNEKEEDGSKHRPRGRRVFGKHGKEEEVAATTSTETEEQSTEEAEGTDLVTAPSKPVSSSKQTSEYQGNNKDSSLRKAEPETFLRPNIEAPKTSTKRRIFEDTPSVESARKKKKSKVRLTDL